MADRDQSASNCAYDNGVYLTNNPTWHEEDSLWKADNIIELIRRNRLEPSSVAEVGCGAGGVLKGVSDALPSVSCTGFEISSQAYEICRNKIAPRLSFEHADLLSVDLSKPYDILLAIDVFEHVEDYIGFLRKIKLKGEYKIFHIPLDLSVQAVFRKSPILYSREKYGHLHHFTKEIALSTLEVAGYEVVDVGYTSGSIELGGLPWRTNILKFPRRLLYMINPDLAVRLLGGFSLLVLAK